MQQIQAGPGYTSIIYHRLGSLKHNQAKLSLEHEKVRSRVCEQAGHEPPQRASLCCIILSSAFNVWSLSLEINTLFTQILLSCLTCNILRTGSSMPKDPIPIFARQPSAKYEHRFPLFSTTAAPLLASPYSSSLPIVQSVQRQYRVLCGRLAS